MKREVIVGVKIGTLQENGRVPKILAFIGDEPPSYSVNIITLDDGRKVVALVDSFAGGVAYAVTSEPVNAKGKELEIEPSEIDFMKKNYPALHRLLAA